jgi:hypothetical protein
MPRPSNIAPTVLLHLTRVLAAIPLLLGVGTGVAQAQGGSDPAGDHGRPPHHHMQRSAALDGPPAPAVLRDSIQLSGKGLQQYTQRYESHMSATKASRDSLKAGLQAARSAFEKGTVRKFSPGGTGWRSNGNSWPSRTRSSRPVSRTS